MASDENPYVPDGMPAMAIGEKATSFFEFWPIWLVYLPIVVQWLFLSIRYRSLTLPLISNPKIYLSGMVGVAKSDILNTAGEKARLWILPWVGYQVTQQSIEKQKLTVISLLQSASMPLPVVGKPEIGCRGVGVKLLKNEDELQRYIEQFPSNASIQFQKLAQWEAEAGVFYVRYPDQSRGEITSLTFKYMPYVVGDGRSTLAELISADPRAGQLQHLYKQRHASNWEKIIDAGKPYRLIFAASHSRGAIFRDGCDCITTDLTNALDRIFDDIPGFHYGRLDIKFRDLDSLKLGDDFKIIEINGASSESIHIWDHNARLGPALKTLLKQYNTLFRLGAANRQKGYRPPGVRALFNAWQHEKALVKAYPGND